MIRLKNIKKNYKSKSEHITKALDDVSLNIKTGMVFVVGKSGCGKSTLLNLIGGLDTYESGELIVDDISTKDFSAEDYDHYRNKYIGFVFQEYNLLDDENVEENISVALKMRRGDVDISDINKILERVGLKGFNSRRIDELSGGEKQRVAIARALIKSPEIILADEPTGALDSESSRQILELLKEISKEKPVIVVSHDKEYARAYGDRIIELADGRVINDTEKNVQVFEPATPSKESRERFSDARMHLSFKDAFKTGMRGLKTRKLRMITAVVLASISLFMFGICSAFFVYDRNKIILNSMYDSDIYYAEISKEIKPYLLDGVHYGDRDVTSGDGDVLAFSNKFKKHTFAPVLNFYDGYFRDYLADLGEENYVFQRFYGKAEGGMEMDAALAAKFNFKLLAGRYPAADNELVITEYQYMFFERFGHLEPKSCEKTKIDSYNDLLGKNLDFELVELITGDFIIVGIMDTNLNKQRYKKAWKEEYPTDKMNTTDYRGDYDDLRIELANEVETCGHQLVFLKPGHFGRRHETIKYAANMKDTITAYTHLYDSTNENITNAAKAGITGSKTKLGGAFPYKNKAGSDAPTPVINGFPFDVYWKDSVERTVLKDNEVILPAMALRGPSMHGTPGSQYSDEEIIESFNNGEITGLSYKFLDYDYRIDLDVVGIYTLEESDDYLYYATTFIPDDYYDYLVERFSIYEYKSIAVAMTGNVKEDSKILDYIYSQPNNTGPQISYAFHNSFADQVLSAEQYLKPLRLVFLFAGIAMAFFAGLMIFNYFNNAIADKRKEIGILRALGARKLDIYNIFLSRGLIIAAINAVMAIILTAVGIMLFNHLLKTMFAVYISVVSFGVLSVISVILLSGMTMLLSCIFPIKRIALLPPVEAIKSL